MAQRKQIQLVSTRMWVQSLALLSGSGIQCCYGCGVGGQLYLQFYPSHGNVHVPQVQAKKKKKKNKKKKEEEEEEEKEVMYKPPG